MAPARLWYLTSSWTAHPAEPRRSSTAAARCMSNSPIRISRAESRWYSAQGWTLVGMTGHPEAVLARELALCYTPLALVTDLDAGVEEGEGVTQQEVFEVFAANVTRLRSLLFEIIATLSAERSCPCPRTLDGMHLPFALP